MVLGNGLVANGFKAYTNNENCFVFASGVSNSANRDPVAFQRESNLLRNSLQQHSKKLFIYFSTCSVYDPSQSASSYVNHKKEMEAIIQGNHSDYHIFRISNLAGRTNNPHTVLNFFVQHILNNNFFWLWKNASRNIIDIEDAVAICDYIIQNRLFKNEVVNIANPFNYSACEIVEVIENILGQKGNYELIEKGNEVKIETLRLESLLCKLKIAFDKEYLIRILTKYYTLH